MLQIANDHLRVDLLDPVVDRERLGHRYCAGGYIWQVHDPRSGPLLAGPEWPKPAPGAFNGQGLPESFRHRRRSGEPLTWSGNRGVALGAGELALLVDSSVSLAQPCEWQVALAPAHAVFSTRQQAVGIHYRLERTVQLVARTLLSTTRVTNHGTSAFPVEWFAHPFFALTAGQISAEVPAGSVLVKNPAFALASRTLTQLRVFRDEKDGHLDTLRLPADQPLVVRLNHPKLSGIDFRTSFAPSECLIWGNSNTFSIEPYHAFELGPGAAREWSVGYDFGVPLT
ncbi:hypothetical protein [Opitutus terrae]|uniref:Aldose 1-epimerase n=1 Tax=Opitutus terrae (strain DSM 11246 / JCM 15787 / PB90-1) TaxID=452637 RepID=B1ZY42_OPITP|nr:hypothetical protein [Opitutus terrae]ACB76191.1 hypothetical protein Oter_2910 [Opitutus terrae PB90-1]